MPFIKISGLTTATAVSATNQFEINQNSTSRSATVAQVAAFARGTATDTVVLPAGTVSAPGLTFTGDTNTGIYSPAADTIAFTEGGVEAMRIDSNANVGIGETSITEKLVVRQDQNASTRTVVANQNAGASCEAALRLSAFGASWDVAAGSTAKNSNSFTIGLSTGELMRITAGGNVGIGTSSPAYRLTLVGGAAQISPGTSAQEGVRIQRATGVCSFTGINNDNNAYNALSFATGAAEAMRITTGGDLLVGTTNVVGSGRVGVDFGASGDGIAINNTTTGDRTPIAFYNGNGFVGRISTSGSSTAYLTSSDYRLKQNVVPLTGAAARVQALKPSRFNFIADLDRTVDGFIAHEAAEVVPEAVHGEKDAVNEDGTIKPQGIDHSKLVPLLTAALQEALTEIASLKARVAALENK